MNELEIVRQQLIDGLSIFFVKTDYRMPHVHPEWELSWILEQPLNITCGQRRFVAEPGQMILFSPNVPHEFSKVDQSCTALCLQISGELLPISKDLTADECQIHLHLTEEELRQAKRMLAGIMDAYLKREKNYALYCLGQSFLLFHQLFSRMPTHVLTAEEAAGIDRRNARLNRLLRFVDENYMHKIRLSDFAAAEGCSMSHLSHFIKASLNQNFQEYVQSVRFNRACKLMAEGKLRMLDICMESGFSDYRYFSRAFQQHYGMTPEEFSRSAKNLQPESAVVHRSLHSLERFFSREDSLRMLEQYR